MDDLGAEVHVTSRRAVAGDQIRETVREAATMVEGLIDGPGRLRSGAEGDRAHEPPRPAVPGPARAELGWEATTSLHEGLRRTVEHWRRTSAEWGQT